MAKRANLALAFFANPQFLVLDEPLNGLDTQTIIELREHVSAARKRGQTLLISSHILSFIEEMADEILFIKDGNLVKRAATGEGNLESIYQNLYMG